MATPSIDMSFKKAMKEHFIKFFHSFNDDDSSFKSFLDTFAMLSSSILAHHNILGGETISSAYAFASIIGSISSDALNLEKNVNFMEQNISHDISKLLVGVENLRINDKDTVSNHLKSTAPFPAYIEPCYKWLLGNLHNPYPPKQFKTTIAQQTRTALKDIDAWFIDVRKRIGWNKLRRTCFSNKQDKIIAAATNYFKPTPSLFKDDLTVSLISEVNTEPDFRSDFILLERASKALYSNKFPELVSMFDRSIDQYPPPTAITPERISPESNSGNIAISYPSPAPSLGDDNDNPQQVALPSSSATPLSRSRKRSICEQNDRVSKRPRFRLESPQTFLEEAAASLPSPSNTDDSDTPGDALRDSLLRKSPTPELAASQLKRKRRLSDGDMRGPTKRPHNALCVPRLQSVSDPVPITMSSSEDIPHTSCSGTSVGEHQLNAIIPPPANVENSAAFLTSQNVDQHQDDFSSYNFLPEIFTVADLGSVPIANNFDLPDATKPLSFISDLDDIVFSSSTDAANLQFDLVHAPSYRSDIQCSDSVTLDDFVIFQNTDLLALTSGHLPDLPLCTAYNTSSDIDPPSATYFTTPVLGNFNHTVRSIPSKTNEKEIKRARAQALREELAQLAAEGL